jgi:hypothetical protein
MMVDLMNLHLMNPDFHGVATVVSQRLLFTAVGGTLLAAAVWLLLQLFPRRDSRTNFIVWFSTLLATAMLPLASLYLESRPVVSAGTPAVFTVSTSIAWYAFIVCSDCFGGFGACSAGDIPAAQVALTGRAGSYGVFAGRIAFFN